MNIKTKRVGIFNIAFIEGKLPLVKFYDVRYMHTEYGQFVSSYYASTLLTFPKQAALALDCSVNDWCLSVAETQQALSFIADCYADA